jgi:hypothetical protein
LSLQLTNVLANVLCANQKEMKIWDDTDVFSPDTQAVLEENHQVLFHKELQ